MSNIGGGWSREEEKAFENAIATTNWMINDCWEKISLMVPSKSIEELKKHYKTLIEDVDAIMAGHVPLPCYIGEEDETITTMTKDNHSAASTSTPDTKRRLSYDYRSRGILFSAGMMGNNIHDLGGRRELRSSVNGEGSKSNQAEKRKGIPWTEEEHRLFLLGLDKCGKGDWRSISRKFVISRTPTQVASHAQKYFIRLNSMNRERRRSSIHDITNLGSDNVSSPHCPITGQQTNTTTSSTSIDFNELSHKHRRSSQTPTPPGFPLQRMVSTPCQMTSAIGTPVMIPPPGQYQHHPSYFTVSYPVVPPTMHQ